MELPPLAPAEPHPEIDEGLNNRDPIANDAEDVDMSDPSVIDAPTEDVVSSNTGSEPEQKETDAWRHFQAGTCSKSRLNHVRIGRLKAWAINLDIELDEGAKKNEIIEALLAHVGYLPFV